MYINPFVAGVLAVIFAEFAGIVAYSLYLNFKTSKRKATRKAETNETA